MSITDKTDEPAESMNDRMKRLVFVDKGYIVIGLEELSDGVRTYTIPLSQCGSSDRILSWVNHLSEKSWATTEILRRFVMLATKEAEIVLPHV